MGGSQLPCRGQVAPQSALTAKSNDTRALSMLPGGNSTSSAGLSRLEPNADPSQTPTSCRETPQALKARGCSPLSRDRQSSLRPKRSLSITQLTLRDVRTSVSRSPPAAAELSSRRRVQSLCRQRIPCWLGTRHMLRYPVFQQENSEALIDVYRQKPCSLFAVGAVVCFCSRRERRGRA